jgi:hypothetical protein
MRSSTKVRVSFPNSCRSECAPYAMSHKAQYGKSGRTHNRVVFGTEGRPGHWQWRGHFCADQPDFVPTRTPLHLAHISVARRKPKGGGDHSTSGDRSSERINDDKTRSTYCRERRTWTHGLAASFRPQSRQPGRNRNAWLQDRCRPAASRPDSTQSANRGKNWRQRAQSDDDPRHAGHRPDPLIRAARGET